MAQLRYDATAGTWTLHPADRNDRWMRHAEIDPARDVATLLIEIERDPSGIFWG